MNLQTLDIAEENGAGGHRQTPTNSRLPAGLIALAVGGFGIGLTEFVIAGLLPEVAEDFAVSEATAGWLISGYALAVAVGAIGLTLAPDSPASNCCSG